MKRTYLFSLLATLAVSNGFAASMQQSPSQVPLGEGSPVQNQLSLIQDTQEPSTQTNSNGKNSSISGQSAGGELQTTIIDDNGNLKIVPKNSVTSNATNTQTSNKPGVTSPGMNTTSPNNAGSPRMPTQVNPNSNVTAPSNPMTPANPAGVMPPNSSARQSQQAITAPGLNALPTNQSNVGANQQLNGSVNPVPGATPAPSTTTPGMTTMPNTPSTTTTPTMTPAPSTAK